MSALSTPIAGGAEVPHRVDAEQLRILYRRVMPTTVLGVAFGLLMVVALQPFVDAGALWTWWLLKLLTALVRLGGIVAYQRSTHRDDPRWKRVFMILLAADSLAWGLAGLWLTPADRPIATALVLASLVGVGAVGAFVLQPRRRAVQLFVVLVCVPGAIEQLARMDLIGVCTGTAILMFVAMMIWEAREADRRTRELLALRFTADRIAQERSAALALAERHSQVKGQFLATMSHEMRTPLHGMLGIVRQLLPGAASSTREQLQLAERAGVHLLAIINDVLDFSRIEAGHLGLDCQPFDLAALLDHLQGLSVAAARDKGLTLGIEFSLTRPSWVDGDVARVRQVLHNLVGNAIKFTDRGGITLRVGREVDDAAIVRFEVVDSGIGIAPQDLARIFDAFHQADSSFGRRHAGTGLGLTISRELACAMGGDLQCRLGEAGGSVFIFTARLPAAAPWTPQQPGAVSPASPVRLQGRVLLAEDNPVNAILAQAMLARLGLEVELAADGGQALALFRQRTPDLVMMDCQMPVMDGFATARAMRRHELAAGHPRVPIVAVTANAYDSDRDQCMAAGMDAHLAKPFGEAELRHALQPYLTAR